MAGVKGKSGGARAGSGAKPTAKTLFERAFVGPRMPKIVRRVFANEAEREVAKKERERKKSALRSRALAQKRDSERSLEGREKYARTTSYSKACAHCSANFIAVISSGKYCTAKCRSAVSNAIGLETIKARVKIDPVFALKHRLRSLIRASVRRGGYAKNSRTHEILGCEWQTFATHIELQFLPGMNWDRLGEIHFDHIIPSSSARTESELIALNHFTNLRPMWAQDNLSKGAKITHLI